MGKAKRKRYNGRAKGAQKEAREASAAHRLTFLLAASHLLTPTAPALARRAVSIIRDVAEKLTLRLNNPSVKSALCRRCGVVLVAGAGARVRVRKRRETHLAVTCGSCGDVKRYSMARERELAVNAEVAKENSDAEEGVLRSEGAAGSKESRAERGVTPAPSTSEK